MSDLFVDSWGTGTPVVLVHGSLATGAEEWQAQRPLADEGFRLYWCLSGADMARALWRNVRISCAMPRIAALMGDGAHLVGHSSGLGAPFAMPGVRSDATLWRCWSQLYSR